MGERVTQPNTKNLALPENAAYENGVSESVTAVVYVHDRFTVKTMAC